MSDARKGRTASGADVFLPTLLDRLSQQNTGSMTRNAYRKTVLRDLVLLLNCTSIENQLSLQGFPQVKNSVINFGIPPLAGARFTESDLKMVAASIRHVILRFEPRIQPSTLKVAVIQDKETAEYRYNHARFRIEASYWFEPYPIDLILRAYWDMETGGVDVRED